MVQLGLDAVLAGTPSTISKTKVRATLVGTSMAAVVRPLALGPARDAVFPQWRAERASAPHYR
jgi:hypothetical protein